MTETELAAIQVVVSGLFSEHARKLEDVVAAHVNRDHNPNGYPLRPTRMVQLTAFGTSAYVDLSEVVGVLARMFDSTPSRGLCLRGGHEIYIDDTPENMDKVLR